MGKSFPPPNSPYPKLPQPPNRFLISQTSNPPPPTQNPVLTLLADFSPPASHHSRPRESLTPLSQANPSNSPGFTLITVLITLPPRGALPPHTHSGAAVTGNIIKGKVMNQMNDEDPSHYGDGEGEQRGWYGMCYICSLPPPFFSLYTHTILPQRSAQKTRTSQEQIRAKTPTQRTRPVLTRARAESPGCHHVRNENPSDTEPAIFVAVFLVRTEILDKVGMEGLVLLDAAREERARDREQEVGNHGLDNQGAKEEQGNGEAKEGKEEGNGKAR